MKKIIISCMAFCLSVFAFAQQPGQGQGSRPDPETRAKELTQKMKEIIQFSDDQEKQVYNLNLENAKKRRELYQNRTEDREAMREKMNTLDKEYDASLKKILDEKQFQKYQEEKENIRQRPQQRPEGNQGPRQGGKR